MQQKEFGLIDNWLRHLKDIYQRHETELDSITNNKERLNHFCEVNVIEQVRNVCHTTIVQGAWRRGQPLSVHGWIYGLNDGHLHDLDVTVTSAAELDDLYRMEAER
jgi:carbonic anhydrase